MAQGEVLLWQRLKRKQMMGYDFDRQRPIDMVSLSTIAKHYCRCPHPFP
ncbi:MAG: DUF559 domain-containing protein [Cyanobacteria bacterium P01_F01_bin.13]